MALARKDPLSPGVYWIDVFRPVGSGTSPDGDLPFRGWLDEAGDSVRVLRREPSMLTTSKARIFYVFEVTHTPPAFPFRSVGAPTIQKLAAQGVTDADRSITSDDTAQKPEPEGLTELLQSLEPSLEKYAPALILGAVLWWFFSYKGNSRRYD